MSKTKLINWCELSRKLTGSNQNIRPDKIPKKHEESVNKLILLLKVWEEQIKN